MFGILKHKGLTLLSIASSILIGCSENQPESSVKEKEQPQWTEISGNTQGTTYNAIINDPQGKIHKEALDSILHDFDMALSTYVESSVVSQINNAKDSTTFLDPFDYFKTCFKKSEKIFSETHGAFDPTVFPLVKAWGFFKEDAPIPTPSELDSLLAFVGFGKSLHTYQFDAKKNHFYKDDKSFRLDFNAIAQGQSVDVLSEYFDRNGLTNYYVEIGGEIVVKGHNREGKKWRIGIDSPEQKENTRVIDNVVSISGKAIATSGNYRKFYVKDGIKYAHTINPKTGLPVQHSLLSATVIAESCADADAYATAFMVMGVDKALEFVKTHPELDLSIYLLYDDGEGEVLREMSDGFKQYIK